MDAARRAELELTDPPKGAWADRYATARSRLGIATGGPLLVDHDRFWPDSPMPAESGYVHFLQKQM